MTAVLTVRGLAMQYGSVRVFQDVDFDLAAGQSLGVVGANGAGKTTLLRALVGCLQPQRGEIRINGLRPREAVSGVAVAYFAGEATMPGFVRAAAWGSLAIGEKWKRTGVGDRASKVLTPDRRRLRSLSRGTRQLLGLRTVLGRHPLGLVVMDEPWEGLDPDASRWLTATLETKRDRGAAVVLSSHRLHDLAGLCDAYLFLVGERATHVKAHEIAADAAVTAAMLTGVFDRLQGAHTGRLEISAEIVRNRQL
jgi:ABC-type multidrug transport system ATPase subunit